MANVPSVCQHIRCETDTPWVVAWKCSVSSPVSVEQLEDCSTKTVPQQQSTAGRSWFGLWEVVVEYSYIVQSLSSSVTHIITRDTDITTRTSQSICTKWNRKQTEVDKGTADGNTTLVRRRELIITCRHPYYHCQNGGFVTGQWLKRYRNTLAFLPCTEHKDTDWVSIG